MENVDHTTGVIKTLENGGAEEVEMLLGSSFQLRRSGVIRPGIMVLKSGCSDKDTALYNHMVKEGGHDWDDIERSLGNDKNGKSKLVPKNVDYFTIHPKDCINPADAETIHRLYAAPDGKLRSFPVWFPVNEWWNIIPHSLRCFGSEQGLKYKGVIRDGRMICEHRSRETKNVKRTFRSDTWVERPCNPEECSEYQSGACKFGGAINFYIPGIKGLGIWTIPTTSIYSLISIKSALELVLNMPGGRVAGLFDGKPIFKIRKVLATRYRREPDGTKKRTQQWEITLDSDIDLAEIAASLETPRALARGEKAAALLEGKNTPEKPSDKSGVVLTEPRKTEIPSKASHAEKEKMPDMQAGIKEGEKGGSLPGPTAIDSQSDAAKEQKEPCVPGSVEAIGEPQKNAIRKVALKRGIEKADIEKLITGLNGHDEAGKLIMRIQKGEHIAALETLR
ncbi:MAG: hypothetical protein HZB80_01855 [Deltaproteobacteria bacterium]|nr:hypothetical protein [Deltaproteobacteria bacterium]